MHQSKFEFFQLVEGTVEGVITFVDRYLTTVANLAFLPHRFPENWRKESQESHRDPFVKPFSTAAVSIFLFYLALATLLHNGLHNGLSNEHPAAFNEIRGEYRDYFTLTRLFLYPIPIIVGLYWLSRLVSKLATGEYKGDVASLALYGCSFQCLTFAAYFLSKPTLGSVATLWLFWGFGACTLVVWKTIATEGRLKAVTQLVTSTGYSVLSLIWVFLFIVVGFAIELLVSPAGPKLAEDVSRDARRKDVDRAVEQTAEVLGIPKQEEEPIKQKVFDLLYDSKQP